MSDLKKFYGEGGSQILMDHKNSCICCGGRTHKEEDITLEGEDQSGLYKCRVCGTQIAQEESSVYLLAEPERFEYVISDEYSDYEWN